MSSPLDIVLVVIVIVLLLAVTGCLILLFIKPSSKHNAEQDTEAKTKLENIMAQNQRLEAQLELMQKTYNTLNETINKSGIDSVKNIVSLSEKIETMDQFQKDLNKYNNEIKVNLENIHNTTKNIPSISSEIKGISDIYKHNKNRGNIGEIQLKVILEDIFGKNADFVKPQHIFKTGGIVDYLIKIDEQFVPIDSKFPLDNYRKIYESKVEAEINDAKQLFKRDIVNKFKEVTKYLNHSEHINNVLIFIPSEGMFADIVDWYSDDILIRANHHHVFLCSPTTIIAMLKLFLVNERDKALSKNIEKIKGQISKVFLDFHKVHKN
jgi:DNA recombination protein RmuC